MFERLVALAESALHAPRADYFGVEQYPEFEVKGAVLCSRLIRNHPLPDGNKRTAYICLRGFVERNDRVWIPPDVDEAVAILEGVAARTVSEEELVVWVESRIG